MVSFSPLRLAFLFLFCAAFSLARAQQAVSPIDRARLFQSTPNAANPTVNADGTALAEEDSEASSDDSLGTQIILKKRERVRTFVIAGDASVFYTDNAALTPNNKSDDLFFVTNAGISWTPRINPHLEAQIAARASIFRYNSMSTLDFESLGLSAALFWSPEHFCGINFFARYDFIELLDRHSDEILRDHEFTIGAQRMFSVGRAQTITIGATAVGGIADPSSAQRQQLGIFAGYRWQITRDFDAELFYRFAAYFYDRADRNDCNHVLSANLRYRLSRFADVNGFVSFGANRSDTPGFDYDVVTAGAGVGLSFRF